ncbi:MAG TPA: hypothetical protein VN026_06515 [Bacteroidia bacterium]|jgi:hypothetical protein|nr:hypothetical protein [Bacteroidia bacterium]
MKLKFCIYFSFRFKINQVIQYFFFFFLCFNSLKSDNTLKLRNGESIAVKVKEIQPNFIKFKKFNFPDGYDYLYEKNKIYLIKYSTSVTNTFNLPQIKKNEPKIGKSKDTLILKNGFKGTHVLGINGNVGSAFYHSTFFRLGNNDQTFFLGAVAVSGSTNILYEYGIHKKLGIGLKALVNESIYVGGGHSKNSDASLLLNVHLFTNKKVDLLLGIAGGVSYVEMRDRIPNGNSRYSPEYDYWNFDDLGLIYGLHFQSRFYINKHIGLQVSAEYRGYYFEGSTLYISNVPTYVKLQLLQFNLGIGLIGKF